MYEVGDLAVDGDEDKADFLLGLGLPRLHLDEVVELLEDIEGHGAEPEEEVGEGVKIDVAKGSAAYRYRDISAWFGNNVGQAEPCDPSSRSSSM